MKKILFASLMLANLAAFSQAAYVLPSPTGADEPVTLYIDVSQTTGSLKTILTNHPDARDSVYLWTWEPAGPVAGNGNWDNSNDAMLLHWEGGLLYSMTFVPITFYGVDGPTFFTRGISCLAKLDSGYMFAEDNVGEAKTEDLSVAVIPKLCDHLYCTFPELCKSDDFLSITYDNSKETNAALQNMGSDECYIYLYASYAPFLGIEYAAATSVTSTPALKMKPVPGSPGQFRITFIATDFFQGVPADQTIDEIDFYVLRPGFNYTGSGIPPVQNYVYLDCH